MPRATTARTAARPKSSLRAIDLQARTQRNVSPLELGLIELPSRPRSEYTLKARRTAIEAADSGYLREAADLTRAAMTESGYARGILADLTHGLWGLPRTFIGRADMIADLDDTPDRVGQWRLMFPEPDTIRLMSWGITLGVGVGQMRRRYDAASGDDFPVSPDEAANWQQTKALRAQRTRPIGEHDTRILRTWDPKYLRNQWWDETWWLITADGEIRITPNEGEWLLYLPYGEIRPWEYGAWRSLTLAWLMARDAIFDRSRHAEVLAPVRVGQVPQGTTERQRKRYAEMIRQMQRMAHFVLPPGLDYKIVESSHKIGDIYEQIIAWSEREYAMITGAITTATGQKGFARGDVQERFTRSILGAFASSLSTCLHTGGLVPWGIENYGSPDAPRAEFNTAAPEDLKVRAETLKAAGDALTSFTSGLRAAGNVRPTKASVIKFAQGLGFETEDIHEVTRKPPIQITDTDRAKAYRVEEVRAADGYDPLGDERDDLTLAELDAIAKQKAAANQKGAQQAEQGETAGDGEPSPGPGDAPPTDEAAVALAAKMTSHGVERCEHGSCNRCRLCGVERLRDFDADPLGGAPRWRIAWRPLLRTKAYSNGALSHSILSAGGEA